MQYGFGKISRLLEGIPVPVSEFWGRIPPRVLPGLHLLDTYPYFVTKVVDMLYHVTLLPADWSRPELKRFAAEQTRFNRLDGCLVTSARFCTYFDADGSVRASREAPRGIDMFHSWLRPCTEITPTEELATRREAMSEFIKANNTSEWYIGDGTKGCRPATDEELERLAGGKYGQVPPGLSLCPGCNDWRGECLDPDPRFKQGLMAVSCLCQNNNRCAECGRLLAGRRLNANYYDASNHEVAHVSGLTAFGHSCTARIAVRRS